MFLSNLMLIIFDVASFLLNYFLLHSYEKCRISSNTLICLKFIPAFLLFFNILFFYLNKKKQNYGKTHNNRKYIQISYIIFELLPVLEFLCFINIDFAVYWHYNGPKWIIIFRVASYFIRNFLLFCRNINLNHYFIQKYGFYLSILAIFANITVFIEEFDWKIVFLLFIEFFILIYTTESLLKLVFSMLHKNNLYMSGMSFSNSGILIIKELSNGKYYKIEYYNDKLLHFFNLNEKEKELLTFADFDENIKGFKFQKFKFSVNIPNNYYITPKSDHFNEIFQSLSEILRFYKKYQQQEKSIFYFMRERNDLNNESACETKNPRYKLRLQKKRYLNEITYFLSFEKVEKTLILKEKYDSKTRLLSAFTHELKTPLNGSIPILEELKNERSETNFKLYLEISVASLKILENSLNNIIDYSLTISDQFMINLAQIDFEELLGEVFMIVKTQINLKNLDFCIDIDTELLNKKIMTDYNRLKQLILNILLNSIQFTLKGHILMTVSVVLEAPLTIQFNIKDTGVGMDQENLGKLREKLNKWNIMNQINKTGNCLGLTLSHMIAKLLGPNHDGLDINSTINEGTYITFEIIDHNELNNNKESKYCEEIKHLNYIELRKNTLSGSLKRKMSFSTSNHKDIISFSKFIEKVKKNNKEIHKTVINNSISIILTENDPVKSSELVENKALDINNYDFDQQFLNKSHNIVIKRKNNRRTSKGIYSLHNIGFSSNSWASENNKSFLKSDKKLNEEDFGSIDEFKDEILIVDDDAFNLLSLELILKSLKYKCKKALNGKEAINKLKERKNNNEKNFCLIFMDYQMPIMDGVEATKNIIELINKKIIKDIPIIGCTAFTTKSEISNCLNAGMKDVIFKPLNKNVVTNVLKDWT